MMDDFIQKCIRTVDTFRLQHHKAKLHAKIRIETTLQIPIPPDLAPAFEDLVHSENLQINWTHPINSTEIHGSWYVIKFDPRFRCSRCKQVGNCAEPFT